MDFNLTKIKESRDEILEAMVAHEAENAPIETLIEIYEEHEMRYWQEKNPSAKEVVDTIICRGATLTSQLLADYKLDHEVLTLPDNWNGEKLAETNDG